VVLVLLFAIRGFLRGTVAQVFVVIGVVSGLWAAGAVSHWLGEHWRGAQPAIVYFTLRWLVAALAGLALAALFQWWGDRLGQTIRETPFGWVDRGGGLLVGAALGVVVGAFVLLGALSLDYPRGPRNAAAHSRVTKPTMSAAAGVCALGERYVPGSQWLRQRFLAAKRRAIRIREAEVSAHRG
jgi:hypothetical protein